MKALKIDIFIIKMILIFLVIRFRDTIVLKFTIHFKKYCGKKANESFEY